MSVQQTLRLLRNVSRQPSRPQQFHVRKDGRPLSVFATPEAALFCIPSRSSHQKMNFSANTQTLHTNISTTSTFLVRCSQTSPKQSTVIAKHISSPRIPYALQSRCSEFRRVNDPSGLPTISPDDFICRFPSRGLHCAIHQAHRNPMHYNRIAV